VASHLGQVFRNGDLDRTLETLAREGIEAFYGGEIGQAIVNFSDRMGGVLSLDDFTDFATPWIDPVSGAYRGVTIYELSPTGRGSRPWGC